MESNNNGRDKALSNMTPPGMTLDLSCSGGDEDASGSLRSEADYYFD